MNRNALYLRKYKVINAVNQLVLYGYKSLRKLESKKLYNAKWICDVTIKVQIMQMAKWHIQSQNLPDGMKFDRELLIDDWSDTRVKDALGHIFAKYERNDVGRALYESINLFYWLAAETADKLGFQDDFVQSVEQIEWLKKSIEDWNLSLSR